ncbi:MAG: hydroxymethylglutaryl-CoA lyase [Gammaproteobacteria bacterium]|nr:hydroxymethylglutaryl-CoA lyase [Gammaproteobacteria bacterium]
MNIAINEVAPRDGLQGEKRFVTTEDKVRFINQLSKMNFDRIEVTSFTSPKAIPALADAADVMASIQRNPRIIYSALIPNFRGAERAIEAGVDELNLVMSASETHNLTNLRMTREQSFGQIETICHLAASNGVAVNVSLSCAFGCPMEGEVLMNDIVTWVRRLAGLQVMGISLCDTTGMAFPNQVSELFSRCQDEEPNGVFTAHFHNTRGMGLTNILAAIDAGIRSFDTSLGGIGGCPYAPGATGNVSTEDVVHLLNCMGYDTGLKVDDLVQISRWLSPLLEYGVQSHITKAGPRWKSHPVPDDFEEIRSRAMGREIS